MLVLVAVDDLGPLDDGDDVDVLRTAFLGACTVVLAAVFVLMLLVDNASAVSF